MEIFFFFSAAKTTESRAFLRGINNGTGWFKSLNTHAAVREAKQIMTNSYFKRLLVDIEAQKNNTRLKDES